MQTPLRYLIVLALWLAAASGARAQVVTATLSTTFTNPTPVSNDQFGSAVAALGTDRVIIGAVFDDTGATDAGAAYLFTTNGTLLTTFTNPIPALNGNFGAAVAAVGTDRVIVGAYGGGGSGADGAYLFNTNGTLLITFTNPTPASQDHFGSSVASVGESMVIISAPHDNASVLYGGAVYLFSTNGTLIRTFTKATPAAFDYFGISVAAVGTDKVIIGDLYDDTTALNAGAAYLYSTNGTLLTTFTNPTPAALDAFGSAVAAVGTDKVIIGAYQDDTGATNAGSAYLFSTNGALLRTFTNPTPANSDYFGYAVAGVGADKVLVGAYRDYHAGMPGAAYLFSTNGTLLTKLTNSTPGVVDYFGWAVAGMGEDKVIVGAVFGQGAGTAHLYNFGSPAPPRLTDERVAGGNVRFTWPLSATGFVIERTANIVSLPATNSWSQVPFPYQTNATQISVTVTPAGNQFYRLRQP